MDNGGDAAAAGIAIVFMLVGFVFGIGLYAFFAYTMQKMAQKLGIENSWMAWVPVLNIYLMVLMADKPVWWIALFFLPFVNFVAPIVIWMAIAERLGKPNWFGLLIMVPFVNFWAMWNMAMSE
jgi:hypothetical protein